MNTTKCTDKLNKEEVYEFCNSLVNSQMEMIVGQTLSMIEHEELKAFAYESSTIKSKIEYISKKFTEQLVSSICGFNVSREFSERVKDAQIERNKLLEKTMEYTKGIINECLSEFKISSYEKSMISIEMFAKVWVYALSAKHFMSIQTMLENMGKPEHTSTIDLESAKQEMKKLIEDIFKQETTENYGN